MEGRFGGAPLRCKSSNFEPSVSGNIGYVSRLCCLSDFISPPIIEQNSSTTFIVSYYDKAKNAAISVSDDESTLMEAGHICGRYPESLQQFYTSIDCSPARTGRYVQVTLLAHSFIKFYEVEVHGF